MNICGWKSFIRTWTPLQSKLWPIHPLLQNPVFQNGHSVLLPPYSLSCFSMDKTYQGLPCSHPRPIGFCFFLVLPTAFNAPFHAIFDIAWIRFWHWNFSMIHAFPLFFFFVFSQFGAHVCSFLLLQHLSGMDTFGMDGLYMDLVNFCLTHQTKDMIFSGILYDKNSSHTNHVQHILYDDQYYHNRWIYNNKFSNVNLKKLRDFEPLIKKCKTGHSVCWPVSNSPEEWIHFFTYTWIYITEENN